MNITKEMSDSESVFDQGGGGFVRLRVGGGGFVGFGGWLGGGVGSGVG